MATNGDRVDDLPPPRRPASPRLLWWALIAVVAVVVGFTMFRAEPHRVAPAERGTTVVDRAPVQLPAAK